MEDLLSDLSTYGYILLFLYSIGGGFVGLMSAGVLSFMGKLDLTLSIAVAFIANFLGDMMLFYLARYHKHDVFNYLRQHRRKLALSHLLMKKYGSWVIFIQKFVYGIKTLIPIAIGLSKYNLPRFTILNLSASLIWALVVGIGSYLAGEPILQVVAFIKENKFLIPIIILALLGSLWYYFAWVTKKK